MLLNELHSHSCQINIIAEKKAYLLKHIADNENTDQLLALSQDHKLDQIAEKMARLVYEKLIAEQKYVIILFPHDVSHTYDMT